MTKKIRSHYDNLQIKDSASIEVIKGAYKHLSHKFHPDRNPDEREKAEKVMKMLNEAHRVLSNPELRKEHDACMRHFEFHY
jgi:DnaJ-class molecular chaperone